MQYLVVLIASLLVSVNSTQCYDHQVTDYKSKFVATECNQKCSVTPFFSPDHSVDTYLDLIQSSTKSIDIYTPGFDSWGKCTQFSKECNTCIGCSIEEQREETFPIFPALLNAVHNGINVRLITNNFTQTTCEDSINPLDWLYLNGVQIRFYSSTTFMHSKVVIVDQGKRTSISSVNFSKTSFTKNREAGVVIEKCSCPTIELYNNIFQYDWENGFEYNIDAVYSRADMAAITNTSTMTIPSVTAKPIPGAYVTSKITYKQVMVTRGYTSPDGGTLDIILSDLSQTESSLQVAIYQITDQTLCNKVMDLFRGGVNISIIVSARIVSYIDWKLSQDCYKMLYNNGMKGRIRKAYTKFSFAHQKYWIIDDTSVHLSTGNWSPSDFPKGTTFAPYSKTKKNINRDILVSMEGSDIVRAFQVVFENDWNSGTDW